MKVYIGYDHRSVKLAYKLMEYLVSKGHDVNEPFEANTPDDDYPDIARVVCERVKNDKGSRGILLCGTGIGMNIAANRQRGVRAALAKDYADAYFSRRHEDANIIVLAAGYSDQKVSVTASKNAEKIVDTFLSTEFEGDRHVRRIAKLDLI